MKYKIEIEYSPLAYEEKRYKALAYDGEYFITSGRGSTQEEAEKKVTEELHELHNRKIIETKEIEILPGEVTVS